MVVDDFNLKDMAIIPAETNSPLVIHSNAVLPFPVTLESFEPICRRNSEIIQTFGSIQHRELAKGDRDDRIEPTRLSPLPKVASLFAPEAINHPTSGIVSPHDTMTSRFLE
jgi:hypothetical protein